MNRLSDKFWEARLGITTTQGAASRHPDAHDYGYLAYHTHFSIFERLQLSHDDVVVDLGCGKGRVACIAAQFPIKESVGVEIDPALCRVAEANGRQLRVRRAPVRFECKSATDFDFDAVTAIVMFHPFGAETMNAVLRRLEASLARRPRRVQIAYANPLHTSVLANQSWLEFFEAWNPGTWSRVKFPIHFYRNRAR